MKTCSSVAAEKKRIWQFWCVVRTNRMDLACWGMIWQPGSPIISSRRRKTKMLSMRNIFTNVSQISYQNLGAVRS